MVHSTIEQSGNLKHWLDPPSPVIQYLFDSLVWSKEFQQHWPLLVLGHHLASPESQHFECLFDLLAEEGQFYHRWLPWFHLSRPFRHSVEFLDQPLHQL